MRPIALRAVSIILLSTLSTPVLAYEGGRREEVDAGFHQPVLTKAPELVEFVSAPYPAEAQEEGLAGLVKMLITIDEQGQVAEVNVTEPAGHGFDEAALEAVKRFRFSPAEVDGLPAPIQIEYVYHFELAPPPQEAPPPPKDATLAGQILARGSRSRVPGALVRCGDAAEAPEAVSDAEGRFSFQTPPGTCEVRAVADGFRKFQTTEQLAPGETREVVYHLMPTAIGFETIVRGERDKKEVVRRTLDRQELQRVPGTFGDPIRVLQNLPGVARAPYLSGALIVRGASPDQTETLLDGVPIPLLFHMGGGPSVVSDDFIDRIDFYPGGFGARYGRAVGGIVDVATRKGAADTLHGSAKADFIDSGFFAEAPVAPGVSVSAAARRSYVDVLIPLVLPEDPQGGTLMVLPRYWDYQARVDVGSKSQDPALGRNTFYAMAFGSDDVLRAVATGGGRNRDVTVDVHTVFHRAKGDWTFTKGGFQSVFTPYAGYDLASISINTIEFNVDRYTLGGREDLTLELLPALTVRGGADVVFQHLIGSGDLPILEDYYVPFPGADPQVGTQRIERIFNSFDGAGFLETDLKVGPVTLTPGIRGSYSRIRGHELQAWDPRLWLRWDVTGKTTLKGSVGLYSQPPDPFYMEQAPEGNPDLGHEKAFQTSVGIEHKLTDVINADLTAYYNRRYDNLSWPGPLVVQPDGTTTGLRYAYGNDGLGRAYGLELLVRHEVTRDLFGWIAYTLNRSEERTAGTDKGYVVTSYDETHILTAVASYRLPLGFEFGARFRYVTGRPYTPIDHPYDLYGVDANRYYSVTGERRSKRYAPFNQLDFRIDKTFVYTSWSLDLYLDVQNVYNAANIETVMYDYRYRQMVPVPGLPFLPVLGLKGTF